MSHQPTQIVLSAYEANTGRLMRLARVAESLLRYVADNGTATSLPLKLHDHKGQLDVWWTAPPPPDIRDHIRLAWELECEYEVTHFVGDNEV